MKKSMSLWTAMLAAGLLASGVQAANDTWNVDANGNWTGVSNWLSGTQYPNGLGDIATFGSVITAGRTVTLNAPITLGGMTFNDTVLNGPAQTVFSNGGYTIDQGANAITLDTGTVGFDAGDLVLIDLPTTNKVGNRFLNSTSGGKWNLTDNVRINTSTNNNQTGVEFSLGNAGGVNRGQLAGAGNLTKTGAGQLHLNGDSDTYGGTIRIEEGLIQARGSYNPATDFGKTAFGTGTIQLTNGSASFGATLGFNNYKFDNVTFNNALVLEATHASRDFDINFIAMNGIWAGNISSTSALTANVAFRPYGRASIMNTLTGDNSLLTLASGKKLLTQHYLGVGSANALGAGNALPVELQTSAIYQAGLLATTSTTIASPITVTNTGNVTAAVIGGSITSGSATYNGAITLNSNANVGVRQSFLRSETGGTIVFDSIIGNGAGNGDKAPVTKVGGGLIELNGNNTYLGTTTVRSGQLVLGHNNALGGAAGDVNLGEATTVLTDVRLATTGYENSGTFAAPGTLTGNSTSVDGVVLVAGDRVLVKDQLTSSRNGIYVVQATTSTWVRATDMDADGELLRGLQVRATAGVLNANKVYFQAQAGAMVLNTASLDWHQDIANPNAEVLLKSGITLNRNFNVLANGSSGTSVLGGNGTTGASTFSGNVTLNKGLTVTAATGGDVTFSGDISGGGGFNVAKTGTGKVIFSAAKSYSGTTSVTDGILAVNSTLASSSVSVTGGTLQGTGVITNGVTVAALGTIAPGNSIGTLTVGSADIDGIFNVEVDGTGLGTADLLNVIGNLDITNAVLDLDILATLDDPAYIIANYGSLTGTFAPGNVLDLPTGYVVDYNYQNGNQIALVIPEPATIGLLALGGMMIATRRSK